MMKIDISDVLKQVGNELDIEGSEELNFENDDLVFSGPVKIKVKLINTGETVLLKGKVKLKVRMTCCRCLKEFDLPLDLEVEEEYSKKAGNIDRYSGKKDVELVSDDFIFPVSEDNKIDLTEAIRQNAMTSLPIKPLCNKACRLETGGTKKERPVDPRFSGLSQIKEKIKGGYHASTKEKAFKYKDK